MIPKFALDALAMWWASGSRAALLIENAVAADFCRQVERELIEAPCWIRKRMVYGNPTAIEVDEAQWAAAGVEARLCRSDAIDVAGLVGLVRDAPLSARRALTVFVTRFAFTGGLGAELAPVVPVNPSPGSFEVTRYRPGDFIAAHEDTAGGRLLGVNLYLSDCPAESAAGDLVVADEHRITSRTTPRRGSMSFLRTEPGLRHWVEPYAGAEPGRMTVSWGFSPRSPACGDVS